MKQLSLKAESRKTKILTLQAVLRNLIKPQPPTNTCPDQALPRGILMFDGLDIHKGMYDDMKKSPSLAHADRQPSRPKHSS